MIRGKLDPALRTKAEQLGGTERVSVVVTLSDSLPLTALNKISSLGVRLLDQGSIHAANLNFEQIDKLTEMEEVKHLEMSRKFKLLTSPGFR
ncbi:MAG: hypothetical protein WA941_18475 [Nitrososphaeraceae archaeon]